MGGSKFYSRGHRILAASLSKLGSSFGLNKAVSVLLSGCSAGGVSTYLHSDFVHSQIKAMSSGLTKYRVVPLSGIFPVTIPNLNGKNIFGAQIKYAFSMHNATAGVHQGCIEAASSGEEWLCNTAQGAYPHIESPTFFFNSAYDSWSTACIFTAGEVPKTAPGNGNCSVYADWWPCVGGNGNINHPPIPTAELFNTPSKCTEEQVTTLNQRWRDPVVKLVQSWANTKKAGNGLFVHTCHEHRSANWDGAKFPGFNGSFPNSYHSIQIGGTSIGAK